jgi:hypothetical protein
MFSRLKPSFLYRDVSPDITENDLNVVSDLWTIENRDVYRGSRDPRYNHANVYWLYNEDLQRVGCSEHSLKDHADFRILWFQESEFGTLLQEEGWQIGDDIWTIFPRHVFERFLNEGWTTPELLLDQCLSCSVRIVTPSMLLEPPVVYSCAECKKKSLMPICPSNQIGHLDFPDKAKIYFIDDSSWNEKITYNVDNLPFTIKEICVRNEYYKKYIKIPFDSKLTVINYSDFYD